MSHFEGITLAFSHKDKVWRTRYSFTPTAYATIDNTFISCNGVHPTAFVESGFSDLVWKQDNNSTHNNFYGFQYDTSVAFVANYNPSSVKMFKSLSAESNSNNWSGFVTTNENPAGSDQSELQRAALGDFTRKEGVSYVDIPASEINSTSHIVSGFTTLDGYLFDTNTTSFPLSSVDFYPVSNLGEIDSSNRDLEWLVPIGGQQSQIPVGKSCFLLVRDDESQLCYVRGIDRVPVDSATPSYEDGFAVVLAFNAVTRIVTLGMKLPVQIASLAPFDMLSTLINGWVLIEGLDEHLYIESPAKTNGDYMRGQYLNVYLSNNSVAPVECLAFNVNYEPTKLDHSLGQNA